MHIILCIEVYISCRLYGKFPWAGPTRCCMPHRAASSRKKVPECLSPEVAGKQTAPFEWPCLLAAAACLQTDARHRYVSLSVIYSSHSMLHFLHFATF